MTQQALSFRTVWKNNRTYKIPIPNNKGIKRSEEQKKAQSAKMTGRKLTKEHKLKISLGNKGKKKSPITAEHRKNMSLAKIGKKTRTPSDETRRKISLAQKGKPRPNQLSSDTRKKIGLALSGSKNPRWKGGYENKLFLNRKRRVLKLGSGGSHSLKEWETLILQYNKTCPCCNQKEPDIKLTVDHVIPLTKGGSDNIENIQPLCKSCNSRKNNRLIPRF